MVSEKANLIIESFNLMGYDAMEIGDDDLLLGKEFLVGLSQKARFPFLASNLLDEETGKPLFRTQLIKNINGLRIGIFGLLSPDTFQGQSDPRRKGLVFQSPVETAHALVRELQPKTDLILLLSHLAYPKDVELAQTVQGIHLIAGAHTGVNLIQPPLLKNTLILQTAPKGMYGGRIDFMLHNPEPHFFNSAEKRILEESLKHLKERVPSAEALELEGWFQNHFALYSRMDHTARLFKISFPEEFGQDLRNLIASLKGQDAEKATPLRVKVKGEAEQILKLLGERNEFSNHLFLLGAEVKDHPEIRGVIEAFRKKYPDPVKTIPSRTEAPRIQTGAPKK